MLKIYHVSVIKRNKDNTEKYRNEYMVSVDDRVDWAKKAMIRMCIVFKAESLPEVFETCNIPKSDNEIELIKRRSLRLRDHYKLDRPDITVTEIDVLETKRYRGMAKKSKPNGDLVYLHEYKFWVSNSRYADYPRTYTAVGPTVAKYQGHGSIKKGADEEDHLKQLLKSWHPDADIIELVQE